MSPSGSRYVALGSSFASGPGLPAGTAYPHLVARRSGRELVDVSVSGATTAHVLRERFLGRPPQVDVLDGSESLVTITIAGNDVAMSATTMTAALPGWVHALPGVRRRVAATQDPAALLAPLDHVEGALREVLRTVQRRAPRARVLLVDYLTVLPATGEPAPPIADDVADLVRALAAGLGEATAAAARAEDVTLVPARSASTTHHAWSADPWVSGPSLPLPRRPVAFHPNEAGMTAVADLVLAALDPARE